MLDCCESLENVRTRGISFGKVVCLAHCAGAKVEAFRTNHTTIDEFRKHVITCSTSDNCHVISSYHRSALKQVSIYQLQISLITAFSVCVLGVYMHRWAPILALYVITFNQLINLEE